ncbi:hypothetical protein CBR_g41305 [Chara braunii]|uniref:Mediator of RNA polymerase II transcription subunit 8 n=1 Tax=Chara braunii TaxID=69332 RepID=A0A388LVM3_CHABU|nr:hypothetical protein CBR_g41305 [Chara braunii]|eukprot:GBG86311.1 hypothetical protein CBR_g41305 [Chara braunii]
MASGGGQGKGPDSDLAPVLQQLNIAALRSRVTELQNTVDRLVKTFFAQPNSMKWADVLGQFAIVNAQLYKLVEDMKPVMKMFLVHPKDVSAENAAILPIMLSSKLLPEMEAEQTLMTDQLLGSMAGLPPNVMEERLQLEKQMKTVCDKAEKLINDLAKAWSLKSRQGPNAGNWPRLDAVQAGRIAEQEKLIRMGMMSGEGLRLPPDQKERPAVLPSHLAPRRPLVSGGSMPDTSRVSGAVDPTGPGLPRPPLGSVGHGGPLAANSPANRTIAMSVPSGSAVSGGTPVGTPGTVQAGMMGPSVLGGASPRPGLVALSSQAGTPGHVSASGHAGTPSSVVTGVASPHVASPRIASPRIASPRPASPMQGVPMAHASPLQGVPLAHASPMQGVPMAHASPLQGVPMAHPSPLQGSYMPHPSTMHGVPMAHPSSMQGLMAHPSPMQGAIGGHASSMPVPVGHASPMQGPRSGHASPMQGPMGGHASPMQGAISGHASPMQAAIAGAYGSSYECAVEFSC